MKKILLAVVMCLTLSSCSFLSTALKTLTFQASTKPQQTAESTREYIYKNGIDRVVISERTKNFEQKERKSTLPEKIGAFFAGLSLWGTILVAAGALVIPGFGGWIIGILFNSYRRALQVTVKAISQAKENGRDILKELKEEHNKDKAVKKTINQIRAE
jgi:uncharacterized membrane protein